MKNHLWLEHLVITIQNPWGLSSHGLWCLWQSEMCNVTCYLCFRTAQSGHHLEACETWWNALRKTLGICMIRSDRHERRQWMRQFENALWFSWADWADWALGWSQSPPAMAAHWSVGGLAPATSVTSHPLQGRNHGEQLFAQCEILYHLKNIINCVAKVCVWLRM